MAVSSSSSGFYNSYGIKNTGIGGLMSGLNTEEIVEALTSSTRSKIGKQQQNLQLLSWQQSAYRSVRNALENFRTTHFTPGGSSGGVSNIANANFFNTYTGVTNASDAISLVSSLTSKVGSVEIDQITQLATSQTMTVVDLAGDYKEDLKSAPVTFPPTGGFYGEILTFTIDDRNTVSIRLDGLADVAAAWTAHSGIAPTGVPGDFDNSCKYTQFSGSPPQYVYGRYLQELGYLDNSAGIDQTSQLLEQLTEDEMYWIELQYQIDRHCGAKTNVNASNVKYYQSLESVVKLDKAGITGGQPYTISLDSDASRITIAKDCDVLGLEEEQTNKLDLKKTIAEVFGVSGDKFTFKINNATISVDATDSVQTLMNRINNGSSGVTLEYNIRDQQFIFTATRTGAGNNIKIEDTVGDLMRTFVGAKGGTSLTSNVMTDYSIGYWGEHEVGNFNLTDIEDMLEAIHNSGSASPPSPLTAGFTVVIDSVRYEIVIDPDMVPEMVTKNGKNTFGGRNAGDWLAKTLNSELNKLLKEDDVTNPGVSFSIVEDKVANDGTYIFKIKAPLDEKVEFEQSAVIPDYDLFTVTGMPADNTEASTYLYDLFNPTSLNASSGGNIEIHDSSTPPNPVIIAWGGSSSVQTLADLIDALNTAFGATDGSFAKMDTATGRLTLNAGDGEYALYFDDDGAPSIMEELFGFNKYDGRGIDGLVTEVQGKNAEIVVGGVVISSASDTFIVDGIGFEIKEKWSPTGTEKLTIGSKSNPDDLMDKITEFVDQYNALVKSLNSLIYEAKADGYPPLTEEQRAEMTETQITAWENEAKKGLLRNDSTIRTIIDDLRRVMTEKVKAAGLSLYDIGIGVATYSTNSTGTGYKLEDAGMLEIDENKLRTAIENYPDSIKTLFTNKDPAVYDENGDVIYEGDMGLAHRLDAIIQKATYISSGDNRGSLVRIAGLDMLTADNTSEIGRKITKTEEQIATLKRRLEAEYQRHWKKFTALETALSKLESQSSWLLDFSAS